MKRHISRNFCGGKLSPILTHDAFRCERCGTAVEAEFVFAFAHHKKRARRFRGKSPIGDFKNLGEVAL